MPMDRNDVIQKLNKYKSELFQPILNEYDLLTAKLKEAKNQEDENKILNDYYKKIEDLENDEDNKTPEIAKEINYKYEAYKFAAPERIQAELEAENLKYQNNKQKQEKTSNIVNVLFGGMAMFGKILSKNQAIKSENKDKDFKNTIIARQKIANNLLQFSKNIPVRASGGKGSVLQRDKALYHEIRHKISNTTNTNSDDIKNTIDNFHQNKNNNFTKEETIVSLLNIGIKVNEGAAYMQFLLDNYANDADSRKKLLVTAINKNYDSNIVEYIADLCAKDKEAKPTLK